MLSLGAGRVEDPGRLRVSTASPADRGDWPDSTTVDCLLVDATGGDPAGPVERAREVFPSTPLVAFTDDPAAALAAGAAEVVQSSPAATPDALVRRRVENVCRAADETGPVRDCYGHLLESVGEHLGDVLWVVDPRAPPGNRVEFVSAAYEAVWGRSPEGLVRGEHSLCETVHPADRDTLLSVDDAAWTDEDPVETTYRVARPDGETRWVHERALGVDWGNGRHIVGMCRDITERIERDRKLERQNDLFRKAQDIASVAAWEYNLDGPNRWTDQLYEIFGISHEAEPTLALAEECYHPEDWPAVGAAFDRALTKGERFDLEARIDRDGETRWIHLRGGPRTENGEVVRVRGTVQDITGRIRRERELRAERDLVERILEVSSAGILVFDADGIVVDANEQAARIMGVGTDHLEGESSPPAGVRVLSTEGEPLPRADRTVLRARQSGEAVRDEEMVVEQPDGEHRTVVVDSVPLFEDGDLERVVATLEDVTERVEREERLQTQRDELARLDRINSVIRDIDTALVGAESRNAVEQVVCDEICESEQYRSAFVARAEEGELRVQTACQGMTADAETVPPGTPTRRAVETGAVCTSHDLDDPGWTVCRGPGEGGVTAAVPLSYGERTYGALVVCASEGYTFAERELDVLGELGGTVGHAIAAAESRRREATLASLYEATQDLLAADRRQAVCDVVVETAASVLDPPGAGLFLFDDAANALELVAGAGELQTDSETTITPGGTDSPTWRSYVDGDRQFVSEVRGSELDTGTARGALTVPLGDHGVLVLTTDTTPDEDRRRLVGLLAATAEAALDRVAGQAGLRELHDRLAEQADRLDRLDRLFDLVSGVERALRRAGTRQAAERAVCEQIAEADPYALAWVGSVPSGGTAIEPRAWADSETTGDGRAYLDAVSPTCDGTTPAARALEVGAPVVVSATDHLREADWAAAAVDRGYQSALAVPLAYGDATDGVLVVYATEPDAFDGLARSTIERLGETVPEVAASLERDRAVLVDRVTELDLSLPTPERFPNALAAALDRPVRYRDVTPLPDGQTQVTFALPDASTETVRSLAESFVTVASVESDGEQLRVTLTGQPIATTLLSCGALPGEVLARPDETTATVQLPHDADVRQFLARVDEHVPGVELLARRQVATADTTGSTVRRVLSADLTDRQREVLRTAYESGFFESPRKTTGVELADALGVSQPTVTHHLREAQRRLYDALFDPGLDN